MAEKLGIDKFGEVSIMGRVTQFTQPRKAQDEAHYDQDARRLARQGVGEGAKTGAQPFNGWAYAFREVAARRNQPGRIRLAQGVYHKTVTTAYIARQRRLRAPAPLIGTDARASVATERNCSTTRSVGNRL